MPGEESIRWLSAQSYWQLVVVALPLVLADSCLLEGFEFRHENDDPSNVMPIQSFSCLAELLTIQLWLIRDGHYWCQFCECRRMLCLIFCGKISPSWIWEEFGFVIAAPSVVSLLLRVWEKEKAQSLLTVPKPFRSPEEKSLRSTPAPSFFNREWTRCLDVLCQ